MRLFCRNVNTGFFEGEHREVEGQCQRSDSADSAQVPQGRAPGTVLGKLLYSAWSQAPGESWSKAGEDSSWLQPDFKIDPIRPVTRNPGEPSAGAHHHSTLPRTWACVHTGNNNSHFFISQDKEPGAALNQWSKHFPKASLQVCLIKPYWEIVQ